MKFPDSKLYLCLLIFLSSSILIISSCSEEKQQYSPSTFHEIKGDDVFQKVSAFYSLGPKVSGTDGSRKAAEYLCKELTRMGYVPETDEWKQDTPAGKGTVFRNISATIAGDKTDFLIIGAHYDTKKLDTVPDFAGANDSASGVGVLLAFMETLKKSNSKPLLTLRIFFFDGEEAFIAYTDKDGLYGSRREASKLKASGLTSKCRAAIIIDMVGDKNLNISIPQNSDPILTEKIIAIAESSAWSTYVARGSTAITDDHLPFTELGIPAIDLIDFEYGEGNRYWHTAGDTMDKISPESLGITANLLAKLAFSLK